MSIISQILAHDNYFLFFSTQNFQGCDIFDERLEKITTSHDGMKQRMTGLSAIYRNFSSIRVISGQCEGYRDGCLQSDEWRSWRFVKKIVQ